MLCLIKDELDIHVFVFKNVSFQLWVLFESDLRISCFRNNGETITMEHFLSRKNSVFLRD